MKIIRDYNNYEKYLNHQKEKSLNTEWIEKWLNEKQVENNKMIFYKEPGKSSVYLKGNDNVYYPIISGKHFISLFGNWKENTIKEIDNINPKSESYFGLFKANNEGDYDVV